MAGRSAIVDFGARISLRSSKFITSDGERRLRRQLARLWNEERPQLLESIAAAAAEGDRSENAEYIYGRRRLREIDRKIKYLSERLDQLQIVEIDETRTPEQVVFGAWVEIEDEEGEVKKIRIVGPDEFDASRNFISMDSPIGRALMKKRVDDSVLVKLPKGEVEYTILSIAFKG